MGKEHRSSQTIRLTVMATVMLSIFAHGFSAKSGIDHYARRVEALDEASPERSQQPSAEADETA